VPLSENEQRILRQIERQFQHEHWLARSLRVPDDPRQAARKAKRAVAGFVLGLVALSLSFASSWVVGLLGFVIMLASAVTLVQSLRRLAQDRLARLQSDRAPVGGPQPLGGRPGRGAPGGRWWPGRPGTSGEDDGADQA
jgi:Protein of unknown function (DUF3040)